MKTIALALMLLATPAFAEPAVPLSRVESLFTSKINKTEQLTTLCKSLQSCGDSLKTAWMETTIMRQKYTQAGGKDPALLKRADYAIAEAKALKP